MAGSRSTIFEQTQLAVQHGASPRHPMLLVALPYNHRDGQHDADVVRLALLELQRHLQQDARTVLAGWFARNRSGLGRLVSQHASALIALLHLCPCRLRAVQPVATGRADIWLRQGGLLTPPLAPLRPALQF